MVVTYSLWVTLWLTIALLENNYNSAKFNIAEVHMEDTVCRYHDKYNINTKWTDQRCMIDA